MRFKGVHPSDRKYFTNSKPIEMLPISEDDSFYMSLIQHVGAPAKPIVTKGQEVTAGELIAEANGFVSANVHASVSGTVADITQVDYPVAGTAPCIVIKAAGEQFKITTIDDNAATLADITKSAGIVGMGGAMFPANIKLSPKNPIEILILNGVECEPYLTCDHRIMLERAADLVQGALIIKEALDIKRVVFAVEANKPDAAAELAQAAGDTAEVHILPMLYPHGGEKQLIQSITYRQIPEGKLPSDIGVLVQNVSTVAAIFDAYKLRIPSIRRVVTVTGAVNNPQNILAPIGTPISRLIEFCGGISLEKDAKIVLGGPMTGFSAHSLNIPVYKGMNGVIVLDNKDVSPPVRPCVRCGKCATVCPANLSPIMLENFAANKMYENLLKWKLLSCIECSACNYACPSGRPLKTLFRLAKKTVTELL